MVVLLSKSRIMTLLNNHEVMFHFYGVCFVVLLLPLLFFYDRDENDPNGIYLDDMIHSVDFKIMVYASIAAAFPITADLIINFIATVKYHRTKQVIPRVAICATLLGTSFLHMYFTLYLGSVYATWVILNIRTVMCSTVLLYQCFIRFGHVVTPAYSYLTLFSWNVGSIIRCYGGNLSITLQIGKYTVVVAIILSAWGLAVHAQMYLAGNLKDWYSKWHRTCFELLFIAYVSTGVLTALLTDRDMMYDTSPATILIHSFNTVAFLVMMYVIITNEFRHEHIKAQVQLEVKRMFVKYVSHEVRTPLNSCILGIQYMKQAIRDPTEECVQEIAGILEEVSEGCSTAIDFMNNLLMYEKIDSMELPLYLKRENLSNVCAEVLQSFKMSARQLGVNLKLHVHESLTPPSSEPACDDDNVNNKALVPAVEIDGPKVVIVLRNLMSNALKFTPENGEVSLSIVPICHREGDDNESGSASSCPLDPRQTVHIMPKCPHTDTTHFRVILSDSGRGMAPEEQVELFTKIVQFSPNENQKGGGSGIGLFLSHHIMKDHNLKIQVFSEGTVNRGTHFFVDFPRWKPKDNVQSLKEINYKYKYYHMAMIGKHQKIATGSEASSVGNRGRCLENDNNWKPDQMSVAGTKASTDVDPFYRKQPATLVSKKSTLQVGLSQEGRSVFSVTTDKNLDTLSILVVDDSSLNRKMLIRTLQQHRVGQTVVGLNDGLKLLNHFGVESAAFRSDPIDVRSIEMKYDVILLDDHMTEMDGSVAIRNLRKAGYNGLVVGLTGSVSDEDLNVFCAAGADYALPKPFVMDDFVRILRSHFRT
jgi:signal transduction histidine kinase/CheY-like chemotaxis protein